MKYTLYLIDDESGKEVDYWIIDSEGENDLTYNFCLDDLSGVGEEIADNIREWEETKLNKEH